MTHPLLEHVDDPRYEDRWSSASQVAERAGASKRGMSNRLAAMERAGLVESLEYELPRPWMDRLPRVWRRKT